MPGLVPGIHVFLPGWSKDVDGRDEPGHDEPWIEPQANPKLLWQQAHDAAMDRE